MQIIGMMGKSGSGKNQCADYMQRHFEDLNLVVKQISFAEPIKRMLEAGFGLCYENLNEGDRNIPLIPHSNVTTTVREALQTLGTEWGRDHVNLNVWGELLHSKINALEPHSVDVIIITDVRFQNEYDRLRDMGCSFVNVLRGLMPKSNHRSEESVQFDPSKTITIYNCDTLITLHDKCCKAAEEIMKGGD